MSLEETLQKIESLQHLIGQRIPKWNSPVRALIPAPTDILKFDDYFDLVLRGVGFVEAARITRSADFEILVICRSSSGATIAYDWYNYIFNDSTN